MARSQGLEGNVLVDALVDETGKVTQMNVLSGPILLRQAAMDALGKYKYEPARLDGQAVTTHTQVSFSFHLH